MKPYIKQTLDRLNILFLEHPDAELRYDKSSLNLLCGTKVLSCDLHYDENDNTIYIG